VEGSDDLIGRGKKQEEARRRISRAEVAESAEKKKPRRSHRGEPW
jgi:hypothetical protein